MSKATVYCIRKSDEDNHWSLDFYLKCNKEKYYLYTTQYFVALEETFKNEMSLDCIRRTQSDMKNPHVKRFIDTLPSYVRYIEEEYGIQILPGEKKRKIIRAGGKY